MFHKMDKLEVTRSSPTASESGFSETCSTNVPSPLERTGTSGPNNLQNYLQTWTEEEGNLAANSTTVTLQVNGEELKCTSVLTISEEIVAQLLKCGSSIGRTSAVVDDPFLLSMPSIDDFEVPGVVEPQEECHNWVQQHQSGEINLTASHSSATVDFSTSAHSKYYTMSSKTVNNSPQEAHLSAQNDEPLALPKISMKDRLQPKLPCHAPLISPVPSYLLDTSPCASRTGVAAVKGLLPIDVLSRDLDISSSSSDEESSNHEVKLSKQPMDPDQVVNLDGTKLRINLKLIKKEEARLKARIRQNSESSSTSCSMEDEDLPLYDDDILSDVSLESRSSSLSSPPLKCSKYSLADESLACHQENIGEEVNWLPYREPDPDNQEDYVKREIEGMREYDTWLEQRRLLYSRFIPEKVQEMPTNMQPRVVLKRSRAIDEMALRLAGRPVPSANTSSDNSSSLDTLHSAATSSVSSIQLPSLEDLTGGPAGADEPTLESLLDDLDDICFENTSNVEQTTYDVESVQSALVDDFLSENCEFPNVEAADKEEAPLSYTNACVVEGGPKKTKQTELSHNPHDCVFPNAEAADKEEATLSYTTACVVEDVPKKTEQMDLSHVPHDAECTTEMVLEDAAEKKLSPAANAFEVVQCVLAVNAEEINTRSTVITESANIIPPKSLPSNLNPSSSQLSDSSDEDDAIHLFVSDDEDEYFNNA